MQVAVLATAIALVLGTMAALALQRFRFFGRDFVSLLIILPIALPGVVTGIALANAFTTMIGIELGFFTLVVSHATFCIVTVFNNAVARLRRLGGNLEEASMDLGAGTFRTFYKVTLPMLRSSLLAGGLLAFALSFDEIIVTTFTVGQGIQTLPIWIYQNLFRAQPGPGRQRRRRRAHRGLGGADLDRPEAGGYGRERGGGAVGIGSFTGRPVKPALEGETSPIKHQSCPSRASRLPPGGSGRDRPSRTSRSRGRRRGGRAGGRAGWRRPAAARGRG